MKPKRAPKRPADERRRIILESAQDAFAAAGYDSVGTGDVARAAGVTPPALYRYFPSKRDLYLATLKQAGPRLLSHWQHAMSTASDPLEAIRTLGMAYFDHVQGRAPMMGMWFQALAESGDDAVRETLAASFTAAIDLLEQNIDAGKARGLVREDVDARVAAWHFMAIGLTFDLVHRLDLGGELDRPAVEAWGELYIDSIREDA